ncbi:hypothetical protein BH10PSE2_BH10PSE2_02650 [soil metagenome]
MLRTHLLAATATVALFAASAVSAQNASAPTAPTTGNPAAAAGPVTTASPAAPATTAATPSAATPAAAGNIIDTLTADGHFTTLLAALDKAQLTETLKTQPAISIFAPTDAAFAAMSEADRTRLMDPANVNDLRQLLLYHVVVADVKSSQIEGTKGGVETAARTQVQLDGTGSAIKVDNATVTTADIHASNGAVFAIDQVLNPAASAVASGDADEDTSAAADDATPGDTSAPAAEAPAADAPAASAPPPVTRPTAPDDATVSPMAPPASTTTGPMPAAPGVNAPNGSAAGTVTTTASPPVDNPTDGQTDGPRDSGTEGDDATEAPTAPKM